MEKKESLVIEARELTKVYANGFVAVKGLNLKVYEGEIFGFLGPNGAGKTTTILMLLGLSKPTEGSVRVLGFDPITESLKIKRVTGYLQENMGFYRDLDAFQMLDFIAELNGIRGEDKHSRIERALYDVGLLEHAKKKIEVFSRGMRQRLGIAEILLKEPRVAFLDEPTLGLDPDATNRMTELILSLCREKKMTVVLSTHLLDHAQRICDRFGIMIGGRMVGQGSLEELTESKMNIDNKDYTLEEVYMKYFKGE